MSNKQAFKIWRKKGGDFFDHSSTLTLKREIHANLQSVFRSTVWLYFFPFTLRFLSWCRERLVLVQSTAKSIDLSARGRVSNPIPQSVSIPTIARDRTTMCEYKSRELTSRMAYLGKCSFICYQFIVLIRLNLLQSQPSLFNFGV